MRGSRFDGPAGGQRVPRRCGLRRACLLLSLAVFLTPASVAAGSIATSPVPRATVPPSAYGSGLINTPNPIDRSSNLPITGNVQGGKHFRGSIPYNSTTSFGAPLGSTSLDSFLRYSAVPDGLSGYPQGYSPFYSPTGTVTMTLPGYRGVFAPTSPRIAGGLPQTRIDQPSDTLSLNEIPELPSGQYGSQLDPAIGTPPRLQLWSMSRSPAETKGFVADELGDQLTQQSLAQPGVPTMTPEEYQHQLEQLRRDIEKIKSDASRLVETQDLASPQDTAGRMTPQLSPPNPQTPRQEPGDAQMQDLTSMPEGIPTIPSIQPGLRLYDPSADSTGVRTPPSAEVGRTGTTPAPGAQPDAEVGQDAVDRLSASRRVEETLSAVDTKSKFLGHPPGNVPGSLETQNSLSVQNADRLRAAAGAGGAVQDVAELDPSGPARSGGSQGGSPFKRSASLTQSQFDHYMAAGELYMQQGRYYRAADSFTLALVYIPHDAHANLRKSQALLAAGEYVSSAAFLARAIELDAQAGSQSIASLHKANLVEALGGPDAFVPRITDLEEKARGNHTPQFQFLLAYVYYQMDRKPQAQTALEAARQGLPASTALSLLAAAIGDAD